MLKYATASVMYIYIYILYISIHTYIFVADERLLWSQALSPLLERQGFQAAIILERLDILDQIDPFLRSILGKKWNIWVFLSFFDRNFITNERVTEKHQVSTKCWPQFTTNFMVKKQ